MKVKGTTFNNLFLHLISFVLLTTAQKCDEPMTALQFGSISCSSFDGKVGSTCQYACDADEGFELVPPESNKITCVKTGAGSAEWSGKFPCCNKCDKAADIVLVIDSSGSISREDYKKMKKFISSVVGSFNKEVRFAAVRFATQVDTMNKILFEEYDNEGMQEAIQRLPGTGGETALGAALTYTRTTMLAYNNRPGIDDVVWVITDGKSTDSVTKAASLLRSTGAEIFALAIRQKGKKLSIKQLNEVTNNPDNVIEIKGMDKLKEELRSRIVGKICHMSCPYNPPTQPPPPRCKPNPPPAPKGGSVECDAKQADIGVKCDFKCKDTHVLEGIKDTECDEDGKGGAIWTRKAGKCTRKCKKPKPPSYGTVKCKEISGYLVVGSSCKFGCEKGYELVGDKEAECNEDGTWSAKTPKCIPLCKPHPPKGPINGEVECNSAIGSIGTRCTFACHVGYELMGSEKTICEETTKGTAEWSHKAPKCMKKCKEPSPPEYGTVECDDRLIVGATCNFQCEEGYEIVGKKKTVCELPGTWSEKTPKCRPLCKPHPPPKPKYGSVDCDNVIAKVGTICEYKCKNGYELVGSENTICEEKVRGSATWTNKTPKCIKKCTKPKPPTDGSIICSNLDDKLIEGSTCEYECEAGYNVIGKTKAKCKPDGKWSEKAPKCIKPKECDKWGKFPNGKITCSKQKYTWGTNCEFECEKGYIMKPAWRKSSKCNKTQGGEIGWSDKLPCCGKVQCSKDMKKDIVIVMDSSGSVGKHYLKMKTFVASLFDGFQGRGFRFAVVRFASYVYKEDVIYFDQYVNNKKKLKDRVVKFSGPGGKTYTGAALKFVRNKVLPTGRQDITDSVLVLTDGAASDSDELKIQAQALRDMGVETLALGIGEHLSKTLDDIAGSEKNKIVIENMDGLTKELKDKILSKFCVNTCDEK